MDSCTIILKANVIIGHLPSELIASAKIAGYVSVSISSIISAFVIGLMVGVILLLNIIFEYDIKENDLIDGFRNSIIILKHDKEELLNVGMGMY